MALRVLLADESNTIKRVIELSLQDYAVEVRTVNIGTDVIPIAKSFNPDIIFVDVLLQKLSGYEVSRAVKGDTQLMKTPVVLMWSGFMDFDAAKFKASHANGKLEKPFNSEALRQAVSELVPKTKTQTLTNFIRFPDFIEPLEVESQEPSISLAPEPVKAQAEKPTEKWNMDSFENIEEFAQVKLGKKPPADVSDFPSAESWIKQDLNSFKAPPPVDDEKSLMDSLRESHSDNQHEETRPLMLEDITPMPAAFSPSESQVEDLVQKNIKQVIETVVWRVVPEIAERVIREELARLLKEKENEVHLD